MCRRFATCLLALDLWLGVAASASESILEYGSFGKPSIYAPSVEQAHVVLFVSGDGGWNPGVIDMARALAGLYALAVGIDITHCRWDQGAAKASGSA